MSAKSLFINDIVFPTSAKLDDFMNTMDQQDQQRVKKITSTSTTTYQTSSSSMDDSSSLDNNGQMGPRSIMQDVSSDSNTFTIKLDVQQFKPEEVAVTTGEDTITIEGKHEEQRNGQSFVSRHFTRRYTLPKDVDMTKAECKFSAEGVLTLTAPKVRNQNKWLFNTDTLFYYISIFFTRWTKYIISKFADNYFLFVLQIVVVEAITADRSIPIKFSNNSVGFGNKKWAFCN